MDYRNAIKWYQYDPTKWFIASMKTIGLASHLKVFPDNEVRKGQLTMQLKKLRRTQETLAWPSDSNDLAVISWDSCESTIVTATIHQDLLTFETLVLKESQKRPLIVIAGFIHDVADFFEEHPGGRHFLTRYIGKDATTAFFGGVYDHSNAAHNVSAWFCA